MTTQPLNGPVVPVKPQANVYTVLLIIAILALGAAVALTLQNLMNNYGMTLGDIFDPKYSPLPPK